MQLKEGRFSKSASSVKGRVDVRTPRTQNLGGRPFFEKASTTKANARFCVIDVVVVFVVYVARSFT